MGTTKTANRHMPRLTGALLRTQPDGRLVALARDGSEAGFEELVRRHRAGLLRFATGFCSASSADDVVQDSMIKAHRALGAGVEVESPRAWLYGIVRNTALNHLRAERPHEQLDESIDGVEQPPQAFERRQEFSALVTRLGELPEGQRAALVQRELEGRGHDEIAGSLGISPGAVRQLIFRARNSLRTGVGALVPLQLLRLLTATGGGESIGAAAGAGFGLGAAKLGVTAILATGAVVGGAEVPGGVEEPGGGSRAVAAQVAGPVEAAPSRLASEKTDDKAGERDASSNAPDREVEQRPRPDRGDRPLRGDTRHGGPAPSDGGGHRPAPDPGGSHQGGGGDHDDGHGATQHANPTASSATASEPASGGDPAADQPPAEASPSPAPAP